MPGEDGPPVPTDIPSLEAALVTMTAEITAAVEACGREQDLADLQVSLTGKKGRLTAILKNLGKLPAEMRPAAGKIVNETRDRLLRSIDERRKRIERDALLARLSGERTDVTLPPFGDRPGRLHPLTKVLQEIVHIFACMGFDIAEGPEVETDWHNFEALGIPRNHPARQQQATFFIKDRPDLVLRTHTSPVQIRRFLAGPPPIKIVAPGFVYRHDDDPTHSPMFLQIEGLMVDEKTSFSDLKGVLQAFLSAFFGPSTRVRFRASFFQFTEPSGEVDVACVECGGRGDPGCRVCKGTGWLEVLGCGEVDPVVLAHVGVDSERYQGFAFGMGIDRMTMLKYGIDSIQHLYRNDMRFLRQF